MTHHSMPQLNKEQIEQLKDDLDAFFTGRKSGHLDRWSYVNSKKWEDLVEAAMRGRSPYYLAHIEQPVLFKSAGKISEIVENGDGITTMMVRGPGTGAKIVPIVGAVNGNLKTVILVDLSSEFTKIASDRIHQTRPDLDIFELNFDFEAPQNNARINASCLGLELGGTLFNMDTDQRDRFPREKLQHRLDKMAVQFARRHTNWMMVTQPINADSKDVVASYKDKFNDEFALNALQLARQIPGTEDFDPDALFEHTPTARDLGDGNRVIEHIAKPKFDKAVSFKIGGKKYTLKPDFENSAINSYLASEKTFKECAEASSAGFRVVESYYDDKKRIAVHLMELPPIQPHGFKRLFGF